MAKKINVTNKIPTNFVCSDTELTIARKLCTIPAGRFFRLRYASSVKLAAEYKRQGYTLQKVTDTTARTGVYYPNIKGVALKDGGCTGNSNEEWVVPNYIKRNTKTGKNYAVIAPISKGNNSKSTFILTDPHGNTKTITRDEARQYAVPSYWNRDNKPAVMTIELGNVKTIK